MRGTLSVVCRTAAAGARPAAILASFRPVADEIVVAVDDRSDPGARADLAAVADRVLVYPYAEPVDRTLPWLFRQCHGEWAFVIDDDEVPSLALLEALPRLCADEAVVHCSFTRRWLYPDTATYLDDAPWRSEYALRLFRTDPRLVGFSDEFHRTMFAAGPGHFLPLVLWHADAILRTPEERLEKARRYERERPGMRIGGRSLNFAFYVPELRHDPPLAAVATDERRHIERVLAAEPQAGPPRARIEVATREEIDRFWPRNDPEAQDGGLELLERPPRLFAGERRALDVRVRNTGSATWPWGREGMPEVRVGSRWFGASGDELHELELHTLLPASLEPGSEALVPVHVQAPDEPGAYRVSLALVQQHVRRFGEALECEVAVVPRRRVAIVGDDAAVSELGLALGEIPELEPIRLRRAPAAAPGGYPEAPDGRAYLFDDAPAGRAAFAAALLWRSLRLQVGPLPRRAAGLVEALRGCELLVVAGLDGPAQRRERWALRALERKARSLGLRVAETRDAAELLPLLRR